jgi:hypothetical protein
MSYPKSSAGGNLSTAAMGHCHTLTSNAAQGIDRIPGRGALTFTLNGALKTLRIGGILVFPVKRYWSRLLPSSPPPPTTVVA